MIWLIGNKGMLGTELSLLLEKQNISFVATDREVDITEKSSLSDFTDKNRDINLVINCAAYTAVDKAEDDIETCRNLNTLGAANIASCAKNINAPLIHISTDYVFDGKGTRPYVEDDVTNPVGVYGLTKRDGEIAVIENNPSSYIIRTSWLYGKHGNNFVHTMLRLMNERNEIKVVNDQRGSPTWAYDLAKVIIGIKDIPFGIYHFSGEGNITWFDFAKEIRKNGKELGLIKKDCDVKPCTSAEYPAKVTRPSYSVLDKNKIKAALGIEIPSWDKSLKDFLKICVN
jgi:dTDP-4-dehydrorhamnose reductase